MNNSEEHQVRETDKYSLRFMLLSNFFSFMTGLTIHYFTGHN